MEETNCQSCGMPLSMDTKSGGTEADGSISTRYCSHCYQKGAFTMPDLTLSEMQERVAGKLREIQMPDAIVTRAMAEMPHLDRWKE
jgi:hypothetical protein